MPLSEAAAAILGNAPERWLQAIATAALGVALLWLLRRFTERRLALLAQRDRTTVALEPDAARGWA